MPSEDNTEDLEYSSLDESDESGCILFYTPKIVQRIDDNDILSEIYSRYPKLKQYNEAQQEKEERKCFLEFLQEKQLVNDILDKYEMSSIDLIKLFYKKASHMFNTVTYSAKIRKIIEENGYRTEPKEI